MTEPPTGSAGHDEVAPNELAEDSPTGAELAEVAAVDESEAESVDSEEETESAAVDTQRRKINWSRVFAFAILPALAMALAAAAGFLKYEDDLIRDANTTRIESVRVAKESTVALLSYKPDTVEQQLGAARELLTGEFRESYTKLINDVVIPGAKQQQISAVATIPAAASVSAEPNKAVVLVFVNQTVTVGSTAPSDTASSVRVEVEKVGNRWLVSKFDPV